MSGSQMLSWNSNHNDGAKYAPELSLTFFWVVQLLKLSCTVSVHHQAMILFNKIPFFRIVSRGSAGNNYVAPVLLGLFVS